MRYERFRPPKTPLYRWLKTYLDEDSVLGDFANDAMRDRAIWKINDVPSMRRFIKRHVPFPAWIDIRRAFNKAIRDEVLKDGYFNTVRPKISPTVRFDVFKKDGYKCRICGTSPEDGSNVKLEIDHIVPLSKGGDNRRENLWTLCFECNRGKAAKDL